ncbi:tetratricopeptide repeat protein [Gloeobacter kilaueensis]|uniref:Tetratricopeptide repeat protein n=1 Tax=Gloeobacter kilaueensis (strain ATCC BAA-2537 / CCAP 1431/1 / ULC 316 / JS1) TaxID=1183438 RepID=U5QGF4_GLOK1|nr:tetratricopeptide repeat protein [Gloeobacter kilaueensis]AGY56745.1 tetratricopeptide repeat protein [Gloeobacter kilaueensis JS1]
MASFTPKVNKVTKTGLRDRLKLAAAFLKEKRFDEALRETNAVLQAEPNSAQALSLLGSIHLKCRRYDEALAACHKALTIDPLSVSACLGVGMAYLRKKDFKQAMAAFENAVKLDPKQPKVYISLGLAMFGQERFDDAIQYFYRALRFSPQTELPYILIARACRKQGRTADAITALEDLIKIRPESFIAHATLASIYLDKKNYEAAEQILNRALEIKGDKPAPAILLSLAELYIETDRLAPAADLLRSLPSAKKILPQKHKLWGDLYSKQNLVREAAEEYRTASLLAAEDDKGDDIEMESLVEAGSTSWEELATTYRAMVGESLLKARKTRN